MQQEGRVKSKTTFKPIFIFAGQLTLEWPWRVYVSPNTTLTTDLIEEAPIPRYKINKIY
jgi:hypothetical protein